MENDYLLEVNNLKKYFGVRKGFLGKTTENVKAVDGVSLKIKAGETLGIVGESGCGKTTLGRTIVRLYDVTEGDVIFNGNNIAELTKKELRPIRKDIQMIYQDPYASLNPRMTVMDIIAEPMNVFEDISRKDVEKRVIEMLDKVGLQSKHSNRYPHEFSGGQRQRIGIARALMTNPKLIVCDEPISALDVSIQSQVVNLLQDLQDEFGITYMFIAHDLSMVKYISTRICVMYLGKVVELTTAEELYEKPLHPYTQALLSAIPLADPKASEERKRIILKGSVPSPVNPPSGCRFRTRCMHVTDRCKNEEPQLKEVSPGHEVACHLCL